MPLSPMMIHYNSIKEQYKDCIVFYRLGDFYEMFFEDAVKASAILDLTLTGRDCGLPERAPMCGVPFHAADIYISKLISAGEKVAICEQLTEPTGKQLVEREVVKVVTAGTLTNDELIDEKNNNFLLSVYFENGKAGLSWADITTGEFFARNFIDGEILSDVFNAMIKINPAEIISNSEAYSVLCESPIFKQGILPKLEQYTESEFSNYSAIKTLKQQFGVTSLDIFSMQEDDLSVSSAGALIAFLKETQKSVITNINSIKLENVKDLMMIDYNAIRNLELIKTIRDGKRYGSLLHLLDKTKTSMGARKLKSWILSPLNDIDKINYRLSGVESIYNNTLIRQNLTTLLSSVRDIGRLTGKISNGNLNPKDCIALQKSLEVLPNIKFGLLGINSEYIKDITDSILDYSDVCKLISSSIVDGSDDKYKELFKLIKSGYNSELDKLRDLFINSRSAISKIEANEREKTGIKNLKINYNRVFGYYIEVSNSFKDRVPYEYIRKQTLANAERYATEELKVLEEQILSAEENSTKMETALYNEIKTILLTRVKDLQQTSNAIAELDVLLSLATVAKEQSYVKPNVISTGKLNIIEGRHPVVESTLKGQFIPNDCLLDNDENRTMIITGPNMAGKSTYMRQVAIITIMAHIGSFVPAKSAEIPLTDKIFTRIGASDSLINDQSTFMVEMSETAEILKKATDRSLIILDEIGRGTSTYDGLSIAQAVVEYVTSNIKAKTLFATHYHELTKLEGIIEGIKNYKITVKEFQGSIIFLRKIMRGGANKSFGIEVALLAGIIKEVTNRAKEILNNLETTKNNGQKTIQESTQELTEVERIIKDVDINNLSPMQAFNILTDLNEKIKEKSNA